MSFPFANRADAGAVLAKRLRPAYQNRPDVIVLGLPRGGVPVGYEVAHALHAPSDVFLVRKLGVPGHEELAFGAIATGGVRILNEDLVESLGIAPSVIDMVAAREQRELQRRELLYREGRPAPDLRGRTVIVTDDGLATGASMRAAVQAIRALQPARIVVAVPVGSMRTCEEMRREADDVVCTYTPSPFNAVGEWYVDFLPVSDREVRELLERAAQEQPI
jgi:predicted phosphoribosyltransferase